MSFQDVGRTGNRAKTNRMTSTAQGSMASAGGGGLSQISESLLQYQRNVGILDKIVQHLLGLLRKQGKGNMKELQMQYQVQADVVIQLEQRVRKLLKNQPSTPAVIKLTKDFERVQSRVKILTADVDRVMKETKTSNPTNSLNPVRQDLSMTTSPNTQQQQQEESYQVMQMQLQDDRLQEEIMREREEEIRNINRGMHQVNEIFKDLAHIVGSQQEEIDTIETQMEESRVNAESGLKQVEKANENYSNQQCAIS